MTNWTQAAGVLHSALGLETPAVAINFADSLPESVRPWGSMVPAGCRFWQEGTRSVFATSSADHGNCAIGIYTHNLEPTPAMQTDLQDALNVFQELGYVTSRDIPLIPVVKTRSRYLIYAPLAEAPILPDVVLLFVKANQLLILSEATQQVEQALPPALGRPACAVIPQVMNSGRAALSLGCCGARAYLDSFSKDIAVFALPGATLDWYVDKIKILADANNTLQKFHEIRREQIESGMSPTIKESLMALQQQ